MSGTQPIVTLQIIPNKGIPVNAPQRVLIVGQRNAGTQPADVLVEDIQNGGEEDAFFGVNSILAAMIRAFKAINQVSRVDAIPLEDNVSGVKSQGAIIFSGTATSNGIYTITIGSKLDFTVEVAVTIGDTATDIALAAVTAVISNDALPVAAFPNIGNVDLVAIQAGTEGNKITLRITGEVAGISVVVTPMAGGALDPDTSSIFDILIPDDIRYQQIIIPLYAFVNATTYLNSVFNSVNSILDGVAVAADTDTLTNLKFENLNVEALHDSVLIGNKPVSFIELDNIYQGSAILELDYVIASIFAAVKALRLTPGAPISQFVQAAGGSLDAFGGPALASLPYHNTIMPNLPLIENGLNWSETEIAELGTDGVTVFVNDIQKTSIVPRTVFVGFKNLAGINGFLNITDTISGAREYFFNQYKLRFGQTRLTSGDDFLPGRAIVNKAIIEAVTDGLYIDLAGPDFALMRGDADTIALFKQNRIVTVDLETGIVTVNMLVFPVSQLREIRGVLEVSFLVANAA
jgi:hypothetical protein